MVCAATRLAVRVYYRESKANTNGLILLRSIMLCRRDAREIGDFVLWSPFGPGNFRVNQKTWVKNKGASFASLLERWAALCVVSCAVGDITLLSLSCCGTLALRLHRRKFSTDSRPLVGIYSSLALWLYFVRERAQDPLRGPLCFNETSSLVDRETCVKLRAMILY